MICGQIDTMKQLLAAMGMSGVPATRIEFDFQIDSVATATVSLLVREEALPEVKRILEGIKPKVTINIHEPGQ